jgi:hypothetical protein
VKFLPLTSLAPVLAVSGCSDSPSIEENPSEQETKLIEYELCLDTQKNYWTKQLEGADPTLVEGLALENCKDKRP